MTPLLRKAVPLVLAAAFFSAVSARAAEAPAPEAPEEEAAAEVSTRTEKVRLIELYSSQSRSSCPEAEAWFSTLVDHPDLWKKIVPVSFHVSYWDKRGWKDRLALPQGLDRLRGWLSRWRSSTPYAPVIVLDGVEWSGWAKEEPIPAASSPGAGTLTIRKVSENEFRILYSPDPSTNGPWTAHGVLLGFGVKTRIEAGENIGKTLRQDFVALRTDEKLMEPTREGVRATLRLPAKGEPTTLAKGGMGLAVWVSNQKDLQPVQAAGTTFWLRAEKPKKK